MTSMRTSKFPSFRSISLILIRFYIFFLIGKCKPYFVHRSNQINAEFIMLLPYSHLSFTSDQYDFLQRSSKAVVFSFPRRMVDETNKGPEISSCNVNCSLESNLMDFFRQKLTEDYALNFFKYLCRQIQSWTEKTDVSGIGTTETCPSTIAFRPPYVRR